MDSLEVKDEGETEEPNEGKDVEIVGIWAFEWFQQEVI